MRHLLAALVATVVVFMWGFGAWAALGIWDFAFPKAANEAALTEALDANLPATGAYYLPVMPDSYGGATTDPAVQAANDAFETRHREGPIALVLFRKDGRAPMAPAELVTGFAIEFVAALLLACILSVAKGPVSRKAMLGFTVALFASTATWGVVGNFFFLPPAYIAANFADTLIAWTLASVVIAAMLRERPQQAA